MQKIITVFRPVRAFNVLINHSVDCMTTLIDLDGVSSFNVMQTNRRKLTPSQELARTARKEKFKSICKQITAMTDDQRKALAFSMPVTTVEGRVLSGCNQMLLALQCPTATIVGGFRQWLKHGRAVKKGQHGSMIWVPCMHGSTTEVSADGTETKDGEKTGFITGTVFDVSQTEELNADTETVPHNRVDVLQLA